MMETPALVAVCPPAALATAVSKWLALESVVVLSEKLKGALVTAGPALVPSTLNCTLVVFAALAVTVIVPETVVPEAGEVMETVGGAGGAGLALLTLMETPALVAVCPPALLAAAVSKWVALESVVVLSATLKGALITAGPTLVPSTLNCTPVVFAALAVTIIVPETVAPEAGEVMETVGGAGGAGLALLTLMETPALVAVCPAEVLALAASEWLALERVAVLSENLKGALVIVGPALMPSTMNCTLVAFADALAVTAMVPETVTPESGEVMETVGGAGGGAGVALLTLTDTAALVAIFPCPVQATAVSKWLLLESVVVLSDRLKGALVTAVPTGLLSTMNCTLVAFADALAMTVTVPETVAPETGDVMETIRAGFVAPAPVTPTHPAQSSASIEIRHGRGAAPGSLVDCHMGLVSKLIVFSPSVFERPVLPALAPSQENSHVRAG